MMWSTLVTANATTAVAAVPARGPGRETGVAGGGGARRRSPAADGELVLGGTLGSRSGRFRGTAGAEPANPNSHKMADATRLERGLDRALARATTPRGAAIVIASVSTAITVGAGLLVTVVDRENFPSIGAGLWWSVQTVTTVGYGDNIPMNLAGRLVAVLVMLLGISFLTVITASITSTFVARSRREQTPSDTETAMAEQFRRIDSRLERIEAALSRSSPP
jgi:voltage-gated potassium channel